MSLCDSKNRDFEEQNKNDNVEDTDDKDDINYSLPESMQRTKKNKTRIPRNIIVDDEEELLPTINLGNQEEKNEEQEKEMTKRAIINWEHLSDKLVAKRIDILREMVKKQKEEESESDSDEKEEVKEKIKNEDKNDNKNNEIKEVGEKIINKDEEKKEVNIDENIKKEEKPEIKEETKPEVKEEKKVKEKPIIKD